MARNNKRKTRSSKLFARFIAMIVAAVTLIGGGAVTAATAFADSGGASGDSGGMGGNSGSGWEYRFWAYDNADRSGSALNTMYGWNQFSAWELANTVKPKMDALCTAATNNAIAQYGGSAGDYRTVLVGSFVGNSNSGGKTLYNGAPGANALTNALDAQWAALSAQLNAATSNTGLYRDYVKALAHSAMVDPQTNKVCVVLKHDQPAPPNYTLSVTTKQANGFSVSGGTQAIHDVVTTSNNGSSISENVNARVIAHWDGYPSDNTSDKQAAKSFTIGNNTSANSPSFVPSDFGWSMWPAGRIWFDVQVDKQGAMDGAVDTPDREASEQFTSTPPAPEKSLYKEDGSTPISSSDVLSSAMPYVAKIKAQSAGSTNFWLYDIIDTKDAWIGGSEADDLSKVTVTDSSGKTTSAKISIDDSQDGKRIVKAALANPTVGVYTLNVPTAPKPTMKNYTIKDDSKACWNGDGNTCQSGDSKEINKVTPAPNKVWVLDENGGLQYSDEGQTNAVGADNKVFTPGDYVGAVVNGSFPKNLASDLDSYSITDDWTDAAKYVDFNDTSLAKVFVDGKDVTSEFDIARNGTKTIATAKPSILKGTAGLSTAKVVKLYIAGRFITSTDTNGNTIKLTNAGSEKWNNETISTNVPPVYVWTPDPTKDVYGALSQDGANGDTSINKMDVFAGQALKYNIGIDMNTPNTGDRAYDYTKFGVEDNYDVNFTPDWSSITIVDNRDGSKPVARKYYTIQKDVANHKFTILFDTDWIKQYASNSEHVNDSAQNKTQWLSLQFSGKVNSDTPAGTEVRNQAFQIVNDSRTATEVPVVNIPSTKPTKEDLNTNGDDIDSKTVLEGDTLVYRLTLDASPTQEQLAYYVHKLGMVDDYDDEYLALDASGVKVLDQSDGSDVTAKFNIQVTNGVAYVFAKQVDHTNINGDLIKGDPQPSDLKAYDTADIDPLNGATIDQSLMGHKYWIVLNTKVKKSTDGYVIKNQAIQNLENMRQATNIVSNPLKELNPVKDVTVDVGGKSIDQATVKLNSLFNYKLSSSVILANRAYKTAQWGITDQFNTKMDRYTGQWVVVADRDIYNGSDLVYKKGDTIATSSSTDLSKYLSYDASAETVTFKSAHFNASAPAASSEESEEKSDTISIAALVADGKVSVTDKSGVKYLTLGEDLVDAEGKTIAKKGLAVDLANMTAADASPLFTFTYTDGKLSVDATDAYMQLINTRLDLEQGWTAYAQMERINVGSVDNTFTETYNDAVKVSNKVTTKTPENPAITLEKWDDASGREKGDRNSESDALTVTEDSKINFTFKNTGDVPLTDVKLSDKTVKGTGTVEDITCPSTFTGKLAVGEEVTCSGTLKGVKAGDVHTDTASVIGKSIYTGKEVKASDDWNGKTPAAPVLAVAKHLAKTGSSVDILLIAALVALGSGLGFTALRKRRTSTM